MLPHTLRSALAIACLFSLASLAGAQRAPSRSSLTSGGGNERRLPGTVASESKISNEVGGFPEALEPDDYFGRALARLGDVDGDGVGDLAASATGDNDGGTDRGAVWVLFLRPDGSVKAHQKISSLEGGFTGALQNNDIFGASVAGLGDVDGDGTPDMAVGAIGDGSLRGAVWLLFLRPDGTVKAQRKIGAGLSGFTGALHGLDSFGDSVAGLGDLDGDGVPDLAVGTSGDDNGGQDRGAVWVLFLRADGTVKANQKISATQGGFTGTLHDFDEFGGSLAPLGDLDGDGTIDLVVGVLGDDQGNPEQGALWLLFLRPDGTVKSQRKIGEGLSGFTGDLGFQDFFGLSLAALGDLDGNGVSELAVGARGPGHFGGVVWVLFFEAGGTVRSQLKLGRDQGGFTGDLEDDLFACGLAGPGDLDGDGVADLAAGACFDDDGGRDCGTVWLLFLDADGAVGTQEKIGDEQPGFLDTLDRDDLFGSAIAALGDLDGDGIGDLAVGAPGDDDGGGQFENNRGAVWVLFLAADRSVRAHQKISTTAGGFHGFIYNFEGLGSSLAPLGDLDGDGAPELALGAPGDLDGGTGRGALWVLSLLPDGTVGKQVKISTYYGGFAGELGSLDAFGTSLAALGDLDHDGVGDLAVGASGDDDGGTDRGAVWVLFLNSDGTVKAHQKLSAAENFAGSLADGDQFGSSLAALGDLDHDGTLELAVGASSDDDGGTDRGAVWIVSLKPNGLVKGQRKISALAGGFSGTLQNGDGFGVGLAALGDLDGDKLPELAAGAQRDDDAGNERGALWVLFLRPDGTVRQQRKISATQGGFAGTLHNVDHFGRALANLGDVDGRSELVCGAPGDDDGERDHGAVWLLGLEGLPR